MFILTFFRYLSGYIRFRAQGVFIERFLNLLARDRIPIWESRKRGDEYTGCVGASNYRKLRRHAKKAGVRIRIERKRGLPFQRQRYRRRKGLAIGLILFVLFLFGMSRFIWRIEVYGNQAVPEARILEELEGLGIHPGVLRAFLDVRAAEREILLRIGELSWAALNIEGSSIRVEVNESVPPPPMVDPNAPCNIVAGYSGQIVSLRVYEGQSMVREGDAVLEGDLLVSGIKQDRMGQSVLKHALADIRARVSQELRTEVPLNQTEYVETGEVKTRKYLRLFSFDLPLFWPSKIPQPYRVERGDAPLSIFSRELPVSIFTERYILMEAVPVTYTEREAKSMAIRELEALEVVYMDDAEVEARTLLGALNGDVFELKAQYVCLRDIALKKEIFQSQEDG